MTQGPPRYGTEGQENAAPTNGETDTAMDISMSETDTAATTGSSTEEASEWMGTHTWRVENFSQIKERKRYSPEFDIGTYTWRLLLFPRGNDNQRQADYVAVYLDFPEAPFTPLQLCPKAHFELMAVNQNQEEKSLRREASHMFTSQATDWGFTQFLPLQDTQDPRIGFVVNDALMLTVKISVQRDDHLYRLTRKQTGFVGLKNQGATCYMNSLLQYLYHIRYFRKAVYHMPTLETDEPERSIPLALQSLFYKLQYQNSSVNTKDLTKSFGWGTYDAFLQHDIQEMQAILCEKLEEKMKGTKVENAIPELFVGHYSNYVECLNVPYTSSRKQPYMEIQLDVLGCKNIYESLERFCAEERMEGPNKYNAEKHGLQDAKRYARFESFPPVLQLHLKRFDYDPVRNLMVKINAHYEFYDELDLDYNDRAFLSETSDKTVVNKYRLHSVLVHSGGPHGGHYYAFIKSDDKWYKFDDELVKEETESRAITEQFGRAIPCLLTVCDQLGAGDEDKPITTNFAGGVKYPKQSTAYMLVYIRMSDWDRFMCEAGKEDISEPIRKRLEAEQTEKEKRQKEKQEAHLYVVIKLACEKHFAEQLGESYYFDLANFDGVQHYRVHKKTLFEEFKEMVSRDFGIAKHLQRFWLWTQRQNGTTRIEKPLETGSVELKTVLDLKAFKERNLPPASEKNALMTVKLFLETPDIGDVLRPLQQSELLIFVKHYDPKLRKLAYVGHLFVEKTMQIRTILDKAKKLAGLAQDADVIGVEEVKFNPSVTCAELQPAQTAERCQFVRGDIIIVQERVAEAQATEQVCPYPTVKSFLEFIQNSKVVNFRPLENPKDDGFKLELLKTMSYEQVTTELAKHLDMDDPKKIRLTQHNVYAQLPHRSPIKYNGIDSLDAMILHSRQYTNILYYEILDMQLPTLEKMKCMRICFHNLKSELQSEHMIRLPREKTIGDLIEQLKQELGDDYANSDFRVMEILSSKIFKVLDREASLEQLYESYWTYRAEVVPEDEQNLKSNEYMVHCCHCKPDDNTMTIFGDPLWIRVKKGETLREIKKRIQAKLEIPDDEFEQWKFAYHPRQMQPLDYLSDDDEVISKFPRGLSAAWSNGKYFGDNGSFIALQHEDTKPNRKPQQHNRWNTYERGIKIYSS